MKMKIKKSKRREDHLEANEEMIRNEMSSESRKQGTGTLLSGKRE